MSYSKEYIIFIFLYSLLIAKNRNPFTYYWVIYSLLIVYSMLMPFCIIFSFGLNQSIYEQTETIFCPQGYVLFVKDFVLSACASLCSFVSHLVLTICESLKNGNNQQMYKSDIPLDYIPLSTISAKFVLLCLTCGFRPSAYGATHQKLIVNSS